MIAVELSDIVQSPDVEHSRLVRQSPDNRPAATLSGLTVSGADAGHHVRDGYAPRSDAL
jgi:hypothetical protein